MLIRWMPILLIGIVIIIIAGILFSGCGKNKDGVGHVFTKTLGKTDVFRVGDEFCTKPEIMVFLTSNGIPMILSSRNLTLNPAFLE